MTESEYRVTSWASGYDLEAFDCGDAEYNDWLTNSAERACKAGTSAVYLLLAVNGEVVSIAGYYAICPTMIVKEAMPKGAAERLLVRDAWMALDEVGHQP